MKIKHTFRVLINEDGRYYYFSKHQRNLGGFIEFSKRFFLDDVSSKYVLKQNSKQFMYINGLMMYDMDKFNISNILINEGWERVR